MSATTSAAIAASNADKIWQDQKKQLELTRLKSLYILRSLEIRKLHAKAAIAKAKRAGEVRSTQPRTPPRPPPAKLLNEATSTDQESSSPEESETESCMGHGSPRPHQDRVRPSRILYCEVLPPHQANKAWADIGADHDTEGDIICTPQQDTSISDPIVNECSMHDIIKSDPAMNESVEHHITKSDLMVGESPTHDSIKLGRHEHEKNGRVCTKNVVLSKEECRPDQGSISPFPVRMTSIPKAEGRMRPCPRKNVTLPEA